MPSEAKLTERLRDLLDAIASSGEAAQSARLREAAQLLRSTDAKSARAEEAALEAMLAAGAFESAAVQIVGDADVFMLSRGAQGTCLATRVRSDGSEEVMAEGATLALALLAAHLSALLADLEGYEHARAPGAFSTSSLLH